MSCGNYSAHTKRGDNLESLGTQLSSVSLTEREWNRFSGAEEAASEELCQAHSREKDGELTCFMGGGRGREGLLIGFLNPISVFLLGCWFFSTPNGSKGNIITEFPGPLMRCITVRYL